MKKEFTFPTILGLVLLAITTFGVGGVVIRQTTTTQSKADQSCAPTSIFVANVTATSADISFSTQGQCQVTLKLGDNIFNDIRNAQSQFEKRRNHYFQANILTPSTEYKVELLSDGQSLSTQKTFRTNPAQNIKTNGNNFAWGKVFSAPTVPAKGSILYLDIPSLGLLSAFVSDSGNWFIPSSLVFSKEGKLVQETQSGDETISIIDVSGQDYTFSNAANNNQPVPDINLSDKNFKIPQFNQQAKTTTVTATPTVPAQSTSPTQKPEITPNPNIKLQIKYPKSDENIYSQKPEFSGLSPSNTSLNLALTGRNTQSAIVVSGLDGTWKWSPQSSLVLGKYNLRVSTNTDSVQVDFSITQDEGLAFVSTPSAIIETPTLAPTPWPTATLIPLQTATPTPLPTIVQVTPTTIPKALPVTGNASDTIAIFATGLLITALSIFFSR